MIISSRRRVSNLLLSSSCINWPKATRATPGLLATTRNASLWVLRAGIPMASPSSGARSNDTIATRNVIVFPLQTDAAAVRIPVSGRVAFYERDEAVHPALQEAATGLADAAV